LAVRSTIPWLPISRILPTGIPIGLVIGSSAGSRATIPSILLDRFCNAAAASCDPNTHFRHDLSRALTGCLL
jgi:hypothetical protein